MLKKFFIIAGFITASLAFTTTSLSSTEDMVASKKESLNATKKVLPLTKEEKTELLYRDFSLKNKSVPSLASFKNGMKGYEKLLKEKKLKKNILTIVDFSLPSTEKRMWILDMNTQRVLFNTYASHGENTGGKMATEFSNIPSSHQSSLGFYVTAETYYGKNGLSLFIDGMEKKFNSNARERYIVVHGSDYATESYIQRSGRLGRSWGCPAVPRKLAKEIIGTIKEKSAFFIYHPNRKYLENSNFLNKVNA